MKAQSGQGKHRTSNIERPRTHPARAGWYKRKNRRARNGGGGVKTGMTGAGVASRLTNGTKPRLRSVCSLEQTGNRAEASRPKPPTSRRAYYPRSVE